MAEELGELIRRRLVEAMIENARLTREYRDCPERAQEARRQVYQALYESALGRITLRERRNILDLLEPCCPELFDWRRSGLVIPPDIPGLSDPWGA